MIRKDFELIAEVLASARLLATIPTQAQHSNGVHAVQTAAEFMASALARTNGRFDRARFLKAAGNQSASEARQTTYYTSEGAPYSALGGHGADWGDSLGASPLATKLREYTP